MVQTIFLFVHILATCMALTCLFRAEIMLWSYRHKPMLGTQLATIKQLRYYGTLFLWLLWITGLALMVIGFMQSGIGYLFDVLLWTKFFVVSVLTLNTTLLQRHACRFIRPGIALTAMPLAQRRVNSLYSVFSLTSWLAVALFGMARQLDWQVSLQQVLAVYCGLLLLAILIMNALLARQSTQTQQYSFG